ncbi:MAG: hypothetical protein KC503_43010 [Myxococcales bacterium]|nr:hypothetical protein [Myxococcales bacterium]
MRLFVYLALASSLLLFVACSDDHDHTHDGGGVLTVDNHGCDHLQYGPFPNVAAGADHTSAGEAAFHSASKVALEAGKTVYIRFGSKDEGEYGIFSDSADLQLALEDSSGAAVSPTAAAASVSVCSQVKLKQLYDLPASSTYYIKLTLAAAATVTVVIVPPLTSHSDDGGHQHDDAGDAAHAHEDAQVASDAASDG